MIWKKILSIRLTPSRKDFKGGIPRGLTFVNSTMLSIAIADFLNSLFQLHMHIILTILIAAFFSSCILVFDQNKKNIISYLALVGLLLLGAVVGKVFRLDYARAVINVYNWCLTYDRELINYVRWCGFAVMTGILLLTCTVTYIVHRFKRIKYILAIVFTILLIIGCVNKIFIPKISVGVILIYSLVILVEFCGSKLCRSSNVVDNSIATIYLAPVCVMIVVLAVMLPSNAKPIQWSGVKHVISFVQEQGDMWITEIRYYFGQSNGEFGLSFADYSENNQNELGGDVKTNKKNSLIVTTQSRSTSRGYLIGSISDTYTGRKWEKTKIKHDYQSDDYYLDFFELLRSFTNAKTEGYNLTNIVEKREFEIEYKDIMTKTLFYPLKSYKVFFDKPSGFEETGQGALLYKKAKGKGTKYNVQYYELNLNSEVLQMILRNAGHEEITISEESLRETGESVFDYNTSGFDINFIALNDNLAKRSSEIQKNYTTLPETLPDRVRQLAFDITKDCNNDYDKLKAIEAYLNKLNYTTNMMKTPKSEDFVDYFLFEQHQGYCTYFASAMGVLARCVGIPTRYVEGFVVDYKEETKAYSYKVLSKNAHSWVDAYIEGVGWIPFEPTPAFYSGRYTRWQEPDSNIGYHDSGVMVSDYLPTPPVQQNMSNGLQNGSSDRKIPIEDTIFTILFVILCIVLIIVGIVLVYYKFLEKKYYNKFKNATINIKLSMKLSEILRYLSKEGYRLSTDETLYNYAKQIGDRVTFDNTSFLDVVQIFMRARYGEKEIKDKELIVVIKFCKDFEKYLYSKIGKRKMFFDRFVFLHFN